MATRLLIYSNAFAPVVGGVERNIMLLARGLAQSNRANSGDLEVVLATQTPRGEMNDASLPFRVVRQPGLAGLIGLIWRADVIHLAGPCLVPLLLSLLFFKPVVVKHHGYQVSCPNGLLFVGGTQTICPGHFAAHHYSRCVTCNVPEVGWLRSLRMLLTTFPRQWACRLVSSNVAVSNHVHNRLQLPRSRVIYHGISVKESQPSSTHSDPGHVKTFAYVGRLVSEKGLSLLIHASKNLADQGYDFRLVFVGEGPEQPRLEELLTSLGLRNRAEFTGSLGIDAVRRATHTADAVVMPTLMEETAGLSAIEQMMRGGLAIVANVGGLGEMVGHAGLKFAPGDVEGLSSCLRRVLDEPDLPRIMGEQARERAIHVFSEDRMVADHRSLYHDLLTTQPPSTVNLNHGL